MPFLNPRNHCHPIVSYWRIGPEYLNRLNMQEILRSFAVDEDDVLTQFPVPRSEVQSRATGRIRKVELHNLISELPAQIILRPGDACAEHVYRADDGTLTAYLFPHGHDDMADWYHQIQLIKVLTKIIKGVQMMMPLDHWDMREDWKPWIVGVNYIIDCWDYEAVPEDIKEHMTLIEEACDFPFTPDEDHCVIEPTEGEDLPSSK